MRHLLMFLAALSAAPASAVIVATGSVSPAFGTANVPFPAASSGPGKYRLTVTLDRSVDRLYLTEQIDESYNEYCDPDGSGTIDYCGGDDTPSLPFAEVYGVRAASLLFTIDRDYVTPRVDGGYSTTNFFDQGGYFEFDTADAAPFAYVVSLQAVPEPASWALLIVGFGTTGVMLRRPRARGARPRPA